MSQVQCPNCGGYKTDAEKIRIDPKTGQKFDWIGCSQVTWLLVIVSALTTIGFVTNQGILIALALLLAFLGGPALAFWSGTKKSQAEKRAYDLYKYYCKLCGYRWEWRKGAPPPKVSVRPDLIQQGEQRLEEERRQQQRDAEALYYLTHRK